ncbi:MAG: hypothetical protein KC423_18220 [Anaerolineales bacterium]|nr:hypothetical protein [Anaerolineales bacterium]
MSLATPRISDIQTSDLLYYDPSHKDKCYGFCQKRNIDCLPSMMDDSIYYHRQENSQCFLETEITSDIRIDGNWPIFHNQILSKFQNSHLLFVFTFDQLTGVLHFADYGKDVVSLYLYHLLFAYERNLRQLLAAKGEKDPKQKAGQPPFQTWYLKKLLTYLYDKHQIDLSQDINQLRNQIMHAHQLIDQQNYDADDYIYKFSSFETFFNRVQALLKDMKRVNTLLKIEEPT